MLTKAEVNNTNALPGYHFIETLYEGRKTVVWRGVRLADDCPVAIKVLQQDYPTFNELLQFRNQYAIATVRSISPISFCTIASSKPPIL